MYAVFLSNQSLSHSIPVQAGIGHLEREGEREEGGRERERGEVREGEGERGREEQRGTEGARGRERRKEEK